MNNFVVIRNKVPSLSEMKENFIDFIGYKRVGNFSVTLRNFLIYLLSQKNMYKIELDKSYSSKEKNEFIYNCAINTINEFHYFEAYYKEPDVMTQNLIEKFETNFSIRDFEASDIDPTISKDAKKMIVMFRDLKKDLTPAQERLLKKQSRMLIASVDWYTCYYFFLSI